MQISKSFFVICAITLVGSALNLLAGESEAQAKAREALRQKMSELDAQEKGRPAPAPSAPAPSAPAPSASAPAQPAAVTPAPTSSAAPSSVDDEATARAREAMRRKLLELDGPQKAAPAPAPAAPAPPPLATPVVPSQTPPPAAPVPVQVAPAQPTFAPVRPADDESTVRAREAMRQKLRELDTTQQPAPAPVVAAPPPRDSAKAPVARPQTPTPIAPVSAPVNASPQTPTPVAPVSAPVNASPSQPTLAPVRPDDEVAARARAALRQKMAELDGQQPSSVTPEFNPIAAPPSPISGSKEARLADLLRQYKADEITPETYHKQRAKILAEQ